MSLVTLAKLSDTADNYLWAVGAIAATLSLYLVIRANWPKVARIISWPIRAVATVLGFVLVATPRWLWRQAWRQADGATRGPVVRYVAHRRRWFHSIIDEATAPQFAATRHASASQHDKQNRRLDAIDQHLVGLNTRLSAIEDFATAPATPRKTTRRN